LPAIRSSHPTTTREQVTVVLNEAFWRVRFHADPT
jgi:hypothetical protein